MVFITTTTNTNATTQAATVLTDGVLLSSTPVSTATPPTTLFVNTTTATDNTAARNDTQAKSTAKTTASTTPTATTSAANTTDPTTSDIVSLAEKLHIAEFYASLNDTPATASFNALCNKLHLQNDSAASTPVTPLSPPSTPPCTPANPPTTWRPTADRPADHPDVQVANALQGITYNGVNATSVTHLLHLRALQNRSLQAHHMSAENKNALYDHYQNHYIQTLHNTRDRIRIAMRAKIREAIKLGCIKPEALRKRASTLRSKSSSPPKSKNSTIISAAAAAAASAAAEAARASSTPFTHSSTPDLSLEERVHRVFRAHRFLLHESQQVLSQIRVASESNMSPIMSDDDMDDGPDGPHGVPHVNRANNRTVVNVAM